jgi:hypothetical protein
MVDNSSSQRCHLSRRAYPKMAEARYFPGSGSSGGGAGAPVGRTTSGAPRTVVGVLAIEDAMNALGTSFAGMSDGMRPI